VTGYLDGPPPRAFAHRGWHVDDLSGLENSMPAFRRAYDEGFRYLETDVHATADGRLVAFHDLSLDRVTDRVGPIATLPWSEVSRARIAGTEPIPLLADLLEEFPDARFNIDAKADPAVGPLAELIRRTGTGDRVCLGSFSDRRWPLRSAPGRSSGCSERPPWAGPSGRRRSPRRCPSPSPGSPSSTAGSCGPRTGPDWRSTCGPSTSRRRCGGCSTWAWTG
jgi:hypothetical protein